VVPHIAF